MKFVCAACRDPARSVVRGGPYFPFCSPECQDRDLAGWVFEGYRLDGGVDEESSVAGDLPPGEESGLEG
ncbi:MAG: DNA gyrase inhibitor YacG [Planctomycetota bacterium]